MPRYEVVVCNLFEENTALQAVRDMCAYLDMQAYTAAATG